MDRGYYYLESLHIINIRARSAITEPFCSAEETQISYFFLRMVKRWRLQGGLTLGSEIALKTGQEKKKSELGLQREGSRRLQLPSVTLMPFDII